jgi:peptidyl-prolyl cis-trans isomerase D
MMSLYADSILNQPVGAVYGPYFENGSYKLTKILAKQVMPDSVKYRHILIAVKSGDKEILGDSIAKKKIDSVEAAVRAGADFKALVNTYSNDEQSKANGGEYEVSAAVRTQLEKGFSKEISDFVYDNKAGEKKVFKIVNDNFTGYDLVEIMSQSAFAPTAKLATVSKALAVSQETEQDAYAKANEFAGKNTTAKAFDDAIAKQNLQKRVAPNVKVSDFTVQGIGSSRDIIKWMYSAKVGDVSGVFPVDNRYIIAKLTDVQDKGLAKLDANTRPVIEAAIKAQMKAKLIKEKYKSVASLEALSQTVGQPVQQADSFNAYNSFSQTLGYEPKVVGYSFSNALKPGTVSPGIPGQDGVFFITLVSRQELSRPADPMMLNQQKMMLDMQNKNAIGNMLQEIFRRTATIRYNPETLY